MRLAPCNAAGVHVNHRNGVLHFEDVPRSRRRRALPPPSLGRFIHDCAADGVLSGAFAGLSLLLVQGLAATLSNESFLVPFRFTSSLVLGEGALLMDGVVIPIVVGAFASAALGAAFGAIYGVVNASFSQETQHRRARQLAMATLFALALWVFNYQVIARVLFPWFLASPALFQMLVHVGGFGVPLGLRYAGVQRRAPRLWDVYA